MSDTKITVNGPPQSVWPRGAPPLRLEIHDLINDHEQFSLYIQAIESMQALPQSDPLSWFQISGIHGVPITTWQGDRKHNQGYCTHGVSRFPTWHRAYTSLFEQTLQAHAVRIAQEYPDKEKWLKIADSLRAPYWDWAIYITPPAELYDKQVLTVITKDGVNDKYKNPLLSYTFDPPLGYTKSGVFRKETVTKRGDMIRGLESGGKTIKKDVFKTFTLLNNWHDFSMHIKTSQQVANSLETNHDAIHTRIDGDMGEPLVAAFDPIFWLHHSNVDRQLALWQALHPNVWVESQNLNTDLTPFWNTQTTHHTSASDPIRIWTEFAFNYPEFKDLVGQPPNKVQRIILDRVYELYGPDRARGGAIPDSFKDWYARVHSQTYALGGSYSIFLFFGEIPSTPSEWRSADNLAGVADVFANPHPEGCENCMENIDAIHECLVDLTIALQGVSQYDQSPEAVKGYLQSNLKWGVQKLDGTIVPNDQVAGLAIAIESTVISFDTARDGVSRLPTATPPEELIRF